MSKAEVPTQTELARLAATILASHPWDKVANQRRNRTRIAVHLAALLWLRAGETRDAVSKAIASGKPFEVWHLLGDLEEAAETHDTYFHESLRKPDEKVLLAIGTGEEDSELFKWLKNNATAKADEFKTFGFMMKAFRKCFSGSSIASTLLEVSVADARDFQAWRRKERAAEKRSQRRRAKTSQKDSSQDTANRKADKAIPVGPNLGTSRGRKRTP